MPGSKNFPNTTAPPLFSSDVVPLSLAAEVDGSRDLQRWALWAELVLTVRSQAPCDGSRYRACELALTAAAGLERRTMTASLSFEPAS
jgi:hypothetical protein